MPGKKIVYYGAGDIRIEEQDKIPECQEGELLVKVEACAICGSDIKSAYVGNPKMRVGTTMGHEFVGRVVESKTDKFAVNDRVTMATTIGCGKCYYCRKGKSNLCLDWHAMGFYYNGAMAEYVIIPANAVALGNVITVDESIPSEVLALSEPTSCVMNDLSRIPVKEMEYAVVIGLGALGMLHSLVLRDMGVPNIICCDFPGYKKDLMDELGFTTLTPEELDEKYLELSDGLGFELVVITAPSKAVQENALKYARKSGYVSYFASLPVGQRDITIASNLLHYNELVMIGTSDSTVKHVRMAVEFLKRKQDQVKKMVTILPIEQVKDGMEGVREMRYAKVVLRP